MNATLESRTALWLLGLFSIGVYIFQFAPIVVVMLLSFNASRSGAFPMEGVSLQWYDKLFASRRCRCARKVQLPSGDMRRQYSEAAPSGGVGDLA